MKINENVIKIIEKYSNITIIHHIDQKRNLWVTCGRRILKRENGNWKAITKFPFRIPRDLFAFHRLIVRAFRADKCNIYVNKKGKILGIRAGRVYSIIPGNAPHFLFKIKGDCVLHRSIVENENGDIFFGEYFMNPQRENVTIWKISADHSKWEEVYTFPEGKIRHVHGLFIDPYLKDKFWITVGDFEGECYLIRTDQNFQNLEYIGDGSQKFRAVNLFFTKNYINWITDSNLVQNYACRLSREGTKLEIGQKILNSGWYGTSTKEGIHVGFTTVEKGPGIKSEYSDVMVSKDGYNWQIVLSFKKDKYKPVQVFKYGVISCPSGEVSCHDFYFSGEGLIDLDGVSMRVDISVEEE